MAPPLFHSILQKGISHEGKFDTIFISNEKVVVLYGNFYLLVPDQLTVHLINHYITQNLLNSLFNSNIILFTATSSSGRRV